VLEVEVIGALPPGLREEDVRQAALLAASTVGIADGHLAVEFVDAGRIAALNAEHRGKEGPTDVLEAVVHGVLHLTGMDHESDEGEMLVLQAEILGWVR
jgi:probable rRNA maturation factor